MCSLASGARRTLSFRRATRTTSSRVRSRPVIATVICGVCGRAPGPTRRSEEELAPGDDDGGAADLDPLEAIGAAHGTGEKSRRPADLDALGDLDLGPPRDSAVA